MSGAAHKTVQPVSRSAVRRKNRFQRRVALCLMSAMLLSGGMACLFLPHNETAYAGERFDRSTALTTEQLTASSIDDAASRSSQRGDLTVDGTWDMGDQPDRKLTIIHADNPVVRDLINGRDEDQTPAGFNPDHATGVHGQRIRIRAMHMVGVRSGARNWDCRSAAIWGMAACGPIPPRRSAIGWTIPPDKGM